MFTGYSANPLSVRPSRISNQLFGINLEPTDFLMPNLQNPFYGYSRTWIPAAASNEIGSTVGYDRDDFLVNVDVQQFNAKDITVTVNENVLQIECKHEEKEDEHGMIYRHFIRKYAVPSADYQMDSIKSSLSSDGVLTISVPRNTNKDKSHRVIPIEQTGLPSKPIMRKTEEGRSEKVKVPQEDTPLDAEKNEKCEKIKVPQENTLLDDCNSLKCEEIISKSIKIATKDLSGTKGVVPKGI